MTGVVHIVGAGLAGLAAATRLAEKGRRVAVHEAARMAGGRCRSYFDQQLGLTIDNGNHLLLSCNHAALAYLHRIGAPDALDGPDDCVFDFCDLSTSERWRLRPNMGRAPWWILSRDRRVPGTKATDYLSGFKLLSAGAENPDLVYAWIDHVLQKKIGLELTEKNAYGNTTSPTPGMEYADRLSWLQPPEDFNKRIAIWNEVKASL